MQRNCIERPSIRCLFAQRVVGLGKVLKLQGRVEEATQVLLDATGCPSSPSYTPII